MNLRICVRCHPTVKHTVGWQRTRVPSVQKHLGKIVGCWHTMSNYSRDIMPSANLSSTQELRRDCVCCWIASYAGEVVLLLTYTVHCTSSLGRIPERFYLMWTSFDQIPGTHERICLLLTFFLSMNKRKVVSASDLLTVHEQKKGCVCFWPTFCPRTKERLCLLLTYFLSKEQKKGCVCCWPTFCPRNKKKVVSAADLLSVHEQKKGCVCCWSTFSPWPKERLCLLLTHFLSMNKTMIVSAADLLSVHEQNNDCVCCWPSFCPWTKQWLSSVQKQGRGCVFFFESPAIHR